VIFSEDRFEKMREKERQIISRDLQGSFSPFQCRTVIFTSTKKSHMRGQISAGFSDESSAKNRADFGLKMTARIWRFRKEVNQY
jgi:hypothetical protein